MEYPRSAPNPAPASASPDTADELLQSLHGDILASHQKAEPPVSITEGLSDTDPSLVETDSFLTELGYKEKAPLMLLDEKTLYYFRQWKAVYSTRRGCEVTILALSVMLSLTVVIKYTPWPAEVVWPLFVIDVVTLLLNLLSLTYYRLLSWLPGNCHAIIDTQTIVSQSKMFSHAHTDTWPQRLATHLWHQRYRVIAAKLFFEVLAMMVLFAEQSFANGTCTRSDLRNATIQLYWLSCNLEGASEATCIFTAFRILLHPFVYMVLGWTDFEHNMTIFVLCMVYLLVCNLLTPSLAFLHPTLVYGILLGMAMASAERFRRLLYLKELRQRHLEVRPPSSFFRFLSFSPSRND